MGGGTKYSQVPDNRRNSSPAMPFNYSPTFVIFFHCCCTYTSTRRISTGAISVGGGDRTHSQMSGQCPYFCNTGALEDRKETAKLTSKRFHSKTTTEYYRIHSHIPTLPFNGRWSGTTRVGRYQKKHSPTHIHPGHRTSFIHFLHLLRSIASSVFS